MAPGDALVAVTLFVTIGATVVLRGPLGKALADRIAGRRLSERGADAHQTEALERQADLLEQTARDLEDVKHRLGEVEERQDFTERMIARRADAGRASPSEREH
jgi:hypothetical protein